MIPDERGDNKMVKNIPNYAKVYKYIVARYADGGWWFYGAYYSEEKAIAVATEINGIVVYQ